MQEVALNTSVKQFIVLINANYYENEVVIVCFMYVRQSLKNEPISMKFTQKRHTYLGVT